MFQEILYKYGARLRNPSLRHQLKNLKLSDKFSYGDLQALQLMKLKDIVSFAYQHSPFYNSVLRKLGFSADSIQTLDDLKKFPILDKNDLIIHKDEIQSNAKFNKLFFQKHLVRQGNL